MVQLRELFLLENAQFASLPTLDETVESLRQDHLRVQRLVLLQKGSHETDLTLYLFDFAQKLLRQFGVSLAIFHPGCQVEYLCL